MQKRLVFIAAVFAVVFAKQPHNPENQDYQKMLNIVSSNPYPIECPRRKNMSPVDVETHFHCVMRRWYGQMSSKDQSAVFRSIGRTSMVNKKDLSRFVSERSYDKSHTVHQDCLFFNRGLRPYPGNCYKPALFERRKDKKTYEISKELRESWESFFKEVAGDLMYTFDFVLWSEKDDIYNNFWYLILYLKELATAIDNPMDIVSKPYHDAQMERLDGKLITANDTLSYHSETLDTLEISLSQLSQTITSYQNIMGTLQNRLTKIISAMSHDKVDQNTLLRKLKYLSVQSGLVGGLFNNTIRNKNDQK